MEFTFEYKNGGEIKLYHGKGDRKKEVRLDNLGWETDYHFEFIARKIYETFKRSMDILSKEPDYDGRTQGLEGQITLELVAPFSEEFIAKLPKAKQKEVRLIHEVNRFH
jgi:hypothetical protein